MLGAHEEETPDWGADPQSRPAGGGRDGRHSMVAQLGRSKSFKIMKDQILGRPYRVQNSEVKGVLRSVPVPFMPAALSRMLYVGELV